LYYSVHAILEDDEVRLLKAMGHNVCCLGVNSAHGQVQNFRPSITFNAAELELYRQFEELGGKFTYGAEIHTFVLPDAFMDLFDVIIVMHDVWLIQHYWPKFSRRPIIWRTIGQMMEAAEAAAAPLRSQGLLIARYSPVESDVPGTVGSDAMIRFSKSPEIYDGWTGEDGNILTFSNLYRTRYPSDVEAYTAIVAGFPVKLGGIGNEGMAGAIGMVSLEEQIQYYRKGAAYLYASGLDIPYTLNFMEAWMTGIPVVVHAPNARRGKYFEIDKLIQDGVNGFVCGSVETARQRVQMLLSDPGLALQIGSAGRDAAKIHFSTDSCITGWSQLLSRIA
jgi:hypothetical protein